MSTETARAFAKENSLSFIETSAKLEGPEGNVEKAFTTIVTGSYLSFPNISASFAFSYPRPTSFLFRLSHHHGIETQLKRLKSGVRCRSPFALCSPHNTDKPPLELKIQRFTEEQELLQRKWKTKTMAKLESKALSSFSRLLRSQRRHAVFELEVNELMCLALLIVSFLLRQPHCIVHSRPIRSSLWVWFLSPLFWLSIDAC